MRGGEPFGGETHRRWPRCSGVSEEVADRSRLAEAGRLQARAALAALEGRRADAIAAYQAARSVLAAGGFTLDSALAALDFVFAAGPEVLDARAAAEEARVVFERVGAKAYLERLDAVLAGRPTSSPLGIAADTAVASRRVTV